MTPQVDRFIPTETVWIRSHYFSVPETIAYFCGDLSGARVLDVGCGEMLSDFGLLPFGVQHVTGLDLANKLRLDFRSLRDRIQNQGIPIADDYDRRLEYVGYDGRQFPFADGTFDVVVSWSAFEHVGDVPQVLREIKRVVCPGGRVFLQVSPWYHSLHGSHLIDFIKEPYFHLKRPDEWVWQKLNEYVAENPEQRDFLLGHMWNEYQTLNKYSANRFYADVIATGFTVEKTVTVTYEQNLAEAPKDIPLSDLMIYETKMLLRA
jgi:SAM-dependent methyltransferase